MIPLQRTLNSKREYFLEKLTFSFDQIRKDKQKFKAKFIRREIWKTEHKSKAKKGKNCQNIDKVSSAKFLP